MIALIILFTTPVYPTLHWCQKWDDGTRTREEAYSVFSASASPRFATGTDFSLWIKRVELYIQEAGLPEEKKGAELVSLLEDQALQDCK